MRSSIIHPAFKSFIQAMAKSQRTSQINAQQILRGKKKVGQQEISSEFPQKRKRGY